MSDWKTQILERAEPLAAALPGASPSGSDVSYDVDFEKVKSEIDKLTAMSGGQPNWRDIVDISERLLASKSKDFRLLVWSAIGRFNTHGIEGFAESLAVALRVSALHWDTMFPPARRAKARANLFDWMNEQALALLQGVEPTLANGDAVRATQDFYEDLDALLSEKLGDAYGGLGGMRSLLRDKVRSVPEAAVEAPPAPPEPAVPDRSPSPASIAESSPQPTSTLAAVEVPAITGADDVLPALRALGKGIVEAARHLRKADPANAWAYRLHRMGLWLAVKGPPPAEGGRTRIAPPPADARKKLEAKAAAEQWLDLLGAAEDLSGQYIFWFDLHRYVALAMDRLGALFVDARATVGQEVTALVQKLPALTTLAYSDGSPFADPGTQMWLEEEASKYRVGASGGSGSSAVSAEDEEISRRFAEAKELVSGGKVGDGLGLASQLAARAADARLRFRGRMTLGELALSGGKPEIGRPILEQLISEIEQRNLEEWEPTLCAGAMSTLVATYRALGIDSDKPEYRKLYDRLCRLDPATALRWSGS